MNPYVFFWNINKPNAIYSNWYNSPFMSANGIIFNCTEQYFMYHKALIFGDDTIAQKILKETDPGIIKKLGRQVKNFDGEIWSDVSYDIMKEAVLLKFQQNPDLAKALMATRHKVMAEASPYDTIWGIGYKAEDKNALDPTQWKGTNYMGDIMMKTRLFIRQWHEAAGSEMYKVVPYKDNLLVVELMFYTLNQLRQMPVIQDYVNLHIKYVSYATSHSVDQWLAKYGDMSLSDYHQMMINSQNAKYGYHEMMQSLSNALLAKVI